MLGFGDGEIWNLSLGTHTFSACVQGLHVEDVEALHLSQDLQSLETSCLLKVGRDGAGFGAGWEEVGFGFDVYIAIRLISFILKASSYFNFDARLSQSRGHADISIKHAPLANGPEL